MTMSQTVRHAGATSDVHAFLRLLWGGAPQDGHGRNQPASGAFFGG